MPAMMLKSRANSPDFSLTRQHEIATALIVRNPRAPPASGPEHIQARRLAKEPRRRPPSEAVLNVFHFFSATFSFPQLTLLALLSLYYSLHFHAMAIDNVRQFVSGKENPRFLSHCTGDALQAGFISDGGREYLAFDL